MPQELLHGVNIYPHFDHVCRDRMAELMPSNTHEMRNEIAYLNNKNPLVEMKEKDVY
jgi:hypothetical protein